MHFYFLGQGQGTCFLPLHARLLIPLLSSSLPAYPSLCPHGRPLVRQETGQTPTCLLLFRLSFSFCALPFFCLCLGKENKDRWKEGRKDWARRARLRAFVRRLLSARLCCLPRAACLRLRAAPPHAAFHAQHFCHLPAAAALFVHLTLRTRAAHKAPHAHACQQRALAHFENPDSFKKTTCGTLYYALCHKTLRCRSRAGHCYTCPYMCVLPLLLSILMAWLAWGLGTGSSCMLSISLFGPLTLPALHIHFSPTQPGVPS